MNILVCLSSVPDTTSKIIFTENNLDVDTTNWQYIINPTDEFGLTRAVELKETKGAKVTVICVGSSGDEPILRKALAIGADDAIRVDVIPKSSLEVASQIALVVKERKFDVIITGKESIDYNGGCVAPMLATHLNYPFVNNCTALQINNNEVVCTREINNQKEIISVATPVVISGEKGLVEEKDLKIPNIRGIMQARTKPLEVIQPPEISSLQSISRYEKIPKKDKIKLIDIENMDELIEVLNKKIKII